MDAPPELAGLPARVPAPDSLFAVTDTGVRPVLSVEDREGQSRLRATAAKISRIRSPSLFAPRSPASCAEDLIIAARRAEDGERRRHDAGGV
jgi:hypothetical protein